ncbi:ead/Ea22-like family protein [Salmonella enterica subsp. enterica serovar Bareilly]|uniref:Ead/Ea22-like family protein n=2 Tax=Salmonella enterica I TaxID=59201 RepID=A0A3U4YIQ6_SALET|nr:ead/Ea22-like family protein [Salmonella enterica]EAA4491382.1 ead/Ea22-like family protein [Salmonella enterica subsp. enterica]ECB2744056.1 ead/Ea22-like family protein [Salmonella enterica subsp. enterica serovar Chester]ECB4337936.1 ead/Ea22-like family protein [Salmonella enterica subsp. enterica serovar Bareilly]EGZ4469758.1 ead/Ea22-like family protein [Salmonella enterica subsp. enterica serovar Java]EAB8568066.1 ead/Ea22-like family protein [Salmonella enterica subsp. enterica]
MNIDKRALREVAERATQGPWEMEQENIWFTDEDGYTKHLAYVEQGDDVDDKQDHYNTAYIAAANPATMLALLDELKTAKRRITELEKIATDYALKFQKAQDALKYADLLRKSELEVVENNLIDSECHVAELEEALRDKQALLEASEKRNAKLQSENAYIRNRYKELDLLIGKNILVMQAAIIEWQATGDAKSGLAWIYNTLFGPGELPDESEKDAQAYFNRKYAPIDEKLMALHKWFWEQSEADRAAGIRIKGE